MKLCCCLFQPKIEIPSNKHFSFLPLNMKILHTADWHLGKKLDRFHRLEEQVAVMDEMVAIADEQNVDLVLIAGDLFDNFNPGVDAIDLFYKTLKRLSNNGKRPVIAIAGNHDSPALIDSPNPLARECGIILIGHPNAEVVPFTLQNFAVCKAAPGFLELSLNDYHYPVRILHTAYANEIRLKEYFGENKECGLNRVLAENWSRLADEYCDENGVNLLIAHLYMNRQGAQLLDEPDGEKPIKIGNADLVFSDSIPPQIQYTALGHLHAHRNIGSEARPVVYGSSPLCYSFSESGQTKFVTVIDAKPGQEVALKKIALKNGKQLHRKSFTNIDSALLWLNENNECLVELTVETETFLTADERKQIQQAHSGIVHLIPKVKNQQFRESESETIDLGKDLLPLFSDYFKARNGGQKPSDELLSLFTEISNS